MGALFLSPQALSDTLCAVLTYEKRMHEKER